MPEIYNSAFVERWCRESSLLILFSEKNKVEVWRQLWIWLAEAERELGLEKLISPEIIDEMKAQKCNIDWTRVHKKEAELKHDVMAHIHTFGECCPTAAGIIHLGVTSCFVQDNADLIIQRQALEYILERLAVCLDRLANFAFAHADKPTVGRTHYQHASLTTVGKRAALWAEALLDAFHTIHELHANLRFRGVKGAVGTRDALLQLFNGDHAKVRALDATVTKKAGFEKSFDICGQTYPRHQDSKVVFALSLLGSAVHKLAMDIRLLQADGELSEPFEAEQVGSSAMPYKRNPIRCERICGIARYLIGLVQNPLDTFAVQGFERTLDDSSNRRIVMPDAFLAADAILTTLQNVLEGLQLNEEKVSKHVNKSMTSAVLERALMLLTERGENRQKAHARIQEIILKKAANDSAEQLAEALPEIRAELLQLCQQPLLLCGDAEQTTRDFITQTLRPQIAGVLARVKDADQRKQLDV